MRIFEWLFGRILNQMMGISGKAKLSSGGHLVCPSCGQEFPISKSVMREHTDGIPIFMCPGCKKMIRL